MVIYGQTEVQKDLYATLDETGCVLLDEAEYMRLFDVATERRVSAWCA